MATAWCNDILGNVLCMWSPDRLAGFLHIVARVVASGDASLVHDGRGEWSPPFTDSFDLPDRLLFAPDPEEEEEPLSYNTSRALLERFVTQWPLSILKEDASQSMAEECVDGVRALVVLLALFDYRVQRFIRCEHPHHLTLRTTAMRDDRAAVVFDDPYLRHVAVAYARDLQHPDVAADPDRAATITRDFIAYVTPYVMHNGIRIAL